VTWSQKFGGFAPSRWTAPKKTTTTHDRTITRGERSTTTTKHVAPSPLVVISIRTVNAFRCFVQFTHGHVARRHHKRYHPIAPFLFRASLPKDHRTPSDVPNSINATRSVSRQEWAHRRPRSRVFQSSRFVTCTGTCSFVCFVLHSSTIHFRSYSVLRPLFCCSLSFVAPTHASRFYATVQLQPSSFAGPKAAPGVDGS
jgi:hypothetical protein